MEIIHSGVSVYEVEVDLGNQTDRRTDAAFEERLRRCLPSLEHHPCMSGKTGGFLAEVAKGTDLAHVIEHVTIELMYLADPSRGRLSGWTRRRRSRPTYVIHYNAPGYVVGRLGATLALDMVRRLSAGGQADADAAVGALRDPETYFEKAPAVKEPPTRVEGLHCNTMEGASWEQVGRLFSHLTDQDLDEISGAWRRRLFVYGGEFSRRIAEKVALLNPDAFLQALQSGNGHAFLHGVRRASQVVAACGIPLHFIIHSLWLYRNALQARLAPYGHQASLAAVEFLFDQILKQFATRKDVDAETGDDLPRFTEFREKRGHGRGLVLVVDDDEMTRRACRDILRFGGYEVITAGTPAEALELVRACSVDVVLLDVQLSGRQRGDALQAEMKAVAPELPVLLMSGYGKPDLAPPGLPFLAKPFSSAVLTRAVEKAVSRRSRPAPA